MKLALIAALAVVPVLGTNGPTLGTQEPMVVIRRTDDGQNWRIVHQTPYHMGWVGLLLRDTVAHTAIALKVEWPVLSCGRVGE